MLKIEISKEKSVKTYNRFSKFILVGHNIDGYVNIDFKEYKNYEEAKLEVPKLLNTLDCSGEWDVQFYQVPDDYELESRYGYYTVPTKGDLIFELMYDRVGKILSVYMDNSMIHICNYFNSYTENWNAVNDEFEQYMSDENYHTIFLREKKVIKVKNRLLDMDTSVFYK